MTEEPWSWPDVAREIRPLVEALTPDEALAIIRALAAVENEHYLGPTLAGHIRGYAQRREDRKHGR